MNRMKLLFALLIAAILSGCVTERVIYREPTPAPATNPQSQQSAPIIVRAPAPCPVGTYPALWNGQPVCVVNQGQYTNVYSYNPGFGWGVVTGVVGTIVLQRGSHVFHPYHRRR